MRVGTMQEKASLDWQGEVRGRRGGSAGAFRLGVNHGGIDGTRGGGDCWERL